MQITGHINNIRTMGRNLERSKKQRNNRRYYLHRKCREDGFKIDAWVHTVYVPFSENIGTETLAKPVRALVKEFDYSVQIEIPMRVYKKNVK